MQEKKKIIICVMGKSGSGKSTLIKLANCIFPMMHIVKSFTTRAVRENDPNDINTHTFVDDHKFTEDLNDNRIMSLYQSELGYFNWTTDESFKEINLYAIDPEAYIKLLNEYSDKYDIIGIYIDTGERYLKERLKLRNDGIDYGKEEHLSYNVLIDGGVPFRFVFNDNSDNIDEVLKSFLYTIVQERVNGEDFQRELQEIKKSWKRTDK